MSPTTSPALPGLGGKRQKAHGHWLSQRAEDMDYQADTDCIGMDGAHLSAKHSPSIVMTF